MEALDALESQGEGLRYLAAIRLLFSNPAARLVIRTAARRIKDCTTGEEVEDEGGRWPTMPSRGSPV